LVLEKNISEALSVKEFRPIDKKNISMKNAIE
jgi:hypothetical protein